MLPLPDTSVRKKEIVAETKPLFNAVKNAEAKILNPHIRSEIEYSFHPCRVSSKSCKCDICNDTIGSHTVLAAKRIS